MVQIQMHMTVRRAWWVVPALHAASWVMFPIAWALTDKQIAAYADWVANSILNRGFRIGLEK